MWLYIAGAGEDCMAASCTLCAIKSKTQDKSDGLELAAGGKKITWFSTANIFSFAVQMKTCTWISSFVFLVIAIVRKDWWVFPADTAQHSSSVMYNIFNPRGPCNITATHTMIHPVSFNYCFNAEACSEVQEVTISLPHVLPLFPSKVKVYVAPVGRCWLPASA